MAPLLDYYLGLQSPWSYLGHERLLALANRRALQIRIRPLNFSLVFAQTGGVPVAKRSPQRQAYRLAELRRWSKRLEIPLNSKPAHFPTNDQRATAMVVAVRGRSQPDALRLAGAILKTVWADDGDIADRDTLEGIAEGLGLDGSACIDAVDDPDHLQTVEHDTRAAIARGVFGAPTYGLGSEFYWGQDRLEFIEAT